MRLLHLLLIFVASISFVSAVCLEGQIDINSASLEDMMKITGLGGTGFTAQKVIDVRPFSSLDDLMRVSGIKEAKLAAIKKQGIACVAEENQDSQHTNAASKTEEETRDTITETEEEGEFKERTVAEMQAKRNFEELGFETKNAEPEVINLDSKDIKTEESNENPGKNYAIYGFVLFSIMLGVLFLIRSRKYKNEFR